MARSLGLSFPTAMNFIRRRCVVSVILAPCKTIMTYLYLLTFCERKSLSSVPTQIIRALVTGRRSTVVNSVDTVDPAELFLRATSLLPSSERQPAGSMRLAWPLSQESPISQTVGVTASVVNPSHDSRVQTPGSTHIVLGEQSAATTPSE